MTDFPGAQFAVVAHDNLWQVARADARHASLPVLH
jgi:hypothetical protein